MKNSICLFLFVCFCFACKEDQDGVFIRVTNTSEYQYKNIIVADKSYGDLNPGESSAYQEFIQAAYSFDYINVEIDDQDFTIQPIDFLGVPQLENGNYTYSVDANMSLDQFDRLSLTFIED